MKKFLFAFTVLYLITFLSVPCLAEEITKVGGTASQGVFANYCYSSDPNDYPAILDGGKYTATTSDGKRFAVIPSVPDSTLMLVIRMIPETEEDAYEWVKNCISKNSNDLIPFDIYFIDGTGNRTELTDSIKIEVSLPDGYGTPVVYHLATNGKATVLKSSRENDTVTFNTDHNSYYVITSENAVSPPTGDSNTDIMVILTMFSLSVLLFIFVIRKYGYKHFKIH